MPDPLSINGLQPGQPVSPNVPGTGAKATTGADGKSFQEMLMDSLDEVNRLQQEAAAGTEKLLKGETDNMAEVFSAVRKADVAFSMLMEMRNKLTEAYREIQQLRV
jgi:flagellar hook-basal body complex protein FliE